MSKKLSAAFLVMIFALSTALIAIPAQAHFTVGRPTGTLPYRVRDFDPHVPGPTGYVWPGSGVVTLSQAGGVVGTNWGSGAPSPVTWAQQGFMFPPGYQSPWSTNPPGVPTSWLQLAGNAYAPFGAILTSTEDTNNVGDLIFGINFTTTGLTGGSNAQFNAGKDYAYSDITIYIPPEFTPTVDWMAADTSNIVTTITGEYGAVYVWKADVKDPFGPGWWVIYINPTWWIPNGAPYEGPGATTKATHDGSIYNPRPILFSKQNNYNEWYYIRVNGMNAPKIAGRYQFKMFLDDHFPTMNVAKADGSLDTAITGSTSFPSTMPVENWPVVMVKGEVDPGIIEGTVRYGAWNTALYNTPLQLPGRVRAVGIADDPYTGASTGRVVEARGYFNASAKGHYEVEGVAPGVYDIYASAAGYPEVKVASGVKILPGKSFHLDFLLQPGPIITGVIYSKHSFGEVRWPGLRPVTVEIYDSNEWPAAKPGYAWDSAGITFERDTGDLVWTDMGYQWSSPGHLKSFSPINLTDSPYTSYVTGNVQYDPAKGYEGALLPNNVPKEVAFPWEHDTVTLPAVSWVGSLPTTVPKDNFGLFNGVGPAQYWWVDQDGTYTNGGGTNSFRFQFGIKGFYGAPMGFDGHIPQVFATWVNGLTAGTYYLRSWVNGYVQTDISGTYIDYPFSVAAEEWAGDINTPMDLETSSWINKTVHFHDLPGTLMTSTIKGPDPYRYLIAEAYDADNVLVAMNFTQVPASAGDYNITLNGFGMAGPTWRAPGSQMSGLWQGVPNGMKFFLYRYRHIRDYGIMPGTYTIRVYMRGYVQQEFEMASISLSQSPAIISNHMYRGAGINMTIYSIDWEHPRVDRTWTFPGDDIRVYVYNTETGANMGYVRFYDRSTDAWSGPAQTGSKTTVPYDTWPSTSTKLKFNGSWALERYGPDAEGWLTGRYWARWWVDYGGYNAFDPGLDGAGKWDQQTGVWLEFGWDWFGFLASPGNYRTGDLKTTVALETGVYQLKGYTLGYVQKKDITVYAAKGQQSDTKINLAQGVNITVNIKFKKEGVFTHVPYNSTFRIRVYDDNNEIVGTWHSSLYDAGLFYEGVITKGNTAYGGYGYGPDAVALWGGPGGQADYPSGPVPGVESRNWVPDSTTELQVLIAGNYFWIENDQYCASCSADYRRTKSYGIDGWPNYQGSYRVEVDAVNLYQSDRSFPAPPGLLLGESHHIINGQVGPFNGLYKYNHLGPWEQKMVVTVPNAHLGAEASVVFELDQRGLLSGNIGAFTWSDELRPVSWASITASGAGGTFVSYSWDGYYDMYLPAGTYELTVAESPGHVSQSTPITVSTGQQVTGFSFYLQRSNIPIPEFGAVIALVAALGASLYILRRTRRKGN